MRIYICGCTCMGDDGNHKTMSHECRDKQLPFAFNSCFRFFFLHFFYFIFFIVVVAVVVVLLLLLSTRKMKKINMVRWPMQEFRLYDLRYS